MRVHELRDGFGLDNLRPGTRPAPVPGPGQVTIRVKAASLNYRDLLMIRGVYDPRQPLPLVPLSDGVGEVQAVGEGVSRVAVGDRVAGLMVQRWLAGQPTRDVLRSTLGGPIDGMLAEQATLSAEGAVKVPAHLSDLEAATLPCAALTAWSALVTHGRVTAGDTVLLQGTGGVSIFALQFARMLGARVIITSSSDAKLARARALGADEGINYVDVPEWGKVVRARTGGRGVDLVVEVGGAGTLGESIRAVRPGGTIALIGVLAGGAARVNMTPVLMNQIRVQGVLIGHRESYGAMCRAIAQHRMKPVVDRVFPFEDARAAFDHLADASHFGKVCVALG
ncbi:MAG: NAD(P)-dependent alcohol dehydrogenase [Myxococcales bacterium]|nr:NAD(P)-dependent alcohol dehydrogenase [Myxococcales bacterium]